MNYQTIILPLNIGFSLITTMRDTAVAKIIIDNGDSEGKLNLLPFLYVK